MVSIKALISMSFALATCSLASGFQLAKSYDASNWFDSFTYHNRDDPTHGTVDYVNLTDAQHLGLTKIVNGQVYMGAESQSVVPSSSRGRKSIWVTSKEDFNHGLLIGDFAHVPASDCGVWPGFWTIREELGAPYGEIDILEYFSDSPHGYITLHSDPKRPDCVFKQSSYGQIGEVNQGSISCSGDIGCSTVGPDNGAGTGFNAAQGGVYAMDWTSEYIKIWHFARSEVPADITAGTPDPSKWRLPNANFAKNDGGCDLDSNFPPQTIYFDTTFCGSMAGGKGWTDWSDCSKKTGVPTCDEFVRKHPEAFHNAYWLVNSVKIYQ
ncbi:hypothetical protein HYFRA_00009218 [Hymenoscyphus fraxineus]|uniref:GH16 domain-containing protein n=1 Tax=Hymenoscyphus fraxineus TaxID=746836 RepID=A0A9N9KV91_9HELO|nr:hypothetical protein HYFRA_00009218 [Hymenoscyphus fraxineus]